MKKPATKDWEEEVNSFSSRGWREKKKRKDARARAKIRHNNNNNNNNGNLVISLHLDEIKQVNETS